MKKSLVALAALAAVGAASAQSSVTLYGVVDVNVQNSKGSDSLTEMNSGGLNGSRWGMRGTEALGGGLNGVFRIEGGFTPDNGNLGQGGRLFGRHATVGLQGGFGTVRLGRNLTPLGALSDEYATLGTKGADLLSVARVNVAAPGVNAFFLGSGNSPLYRADNSITYDSPNMGGLTFQGQYSLAANGAELTSRIGRTAAFNVIYKGGPVFAGLGYITTRVAATPLGDDNKAVQLGLGYNLGFMSVKGMIERDDVNTAEDPTFIGLEASVPLGAFTLAAGVGRSKDSTGAAGVSDDVNLFTLQGVYNLSKRTALYSFYTHVDNKGTAVSGYRTPTPGSTSRLFQLGVRHSF